MASDEEDEILYENLSKKNSYDEVTLNFGRPVIQPNKDDIFSSITFSSPIQDLKPKTPPIPAPRLSKQKSIIKQILPDNNEQIEEIKPVVVKIYLLVCIFVIFLKSLFYFRLKLNCLSLPNHLPEMLC